ncbi:hypothetical protein QJS04_geneDACA005408 [Acorus gramineus]|uniref:Reverse transcriptase n=1 Tax=Acorus gramineus TaxID=55184 RepID=A0AAV9A4I5_ACOGR|nr:hypothetical protein QJS04_geneDACA005408 [Acorus gramineus]
MRTIGPLHTWSNNQENRIISKLERVLVNLKWIQDLADSFVQTSSPGLSNHAPLQIIVNPSIPSGPRLFKYFNAWETHHSFEEVIKKSWNQLLGGTPMYILAKKLHHLKVVLKDWNKEIFGPIQDQLQQCKQKLERAQLKVLQFPQNLSFIREEASLKKDYLSFLRREELLLRQKSKQVWLKEGDRNTKFFYSSIKARGSHNTIRKVKLENGEFSSDPTETFAEFARSSSLSLNPSKSQLFCASNCEEFSVILGIPLSAFPVKHLGLPLHTSTLTRLALP